MATREYSKRLGTISEEQLQQALDHFDLGKCIAAEPIPFGLFGQNLFLTSTKGEFVLRGHQLYSWQLSTEQYFAEQLHTHTDVPVPFPYLVDPEDHIFVWPHPEYVAGYAIMPRLPGINFGDDAAYKKLNFPDRLELAKAMAKLLLRMQRLTSPVAGSYDVEAKTVKPFANGYMHRTLDRIRQNVALSQDNNPQSPADNDWLEKQLQSFELLADVAPATVVMEDFNRHNMLFEKIGATWKVTGLVDLLTCHFGDPVADLSRQFAMFLYDDPSGRLSREYIMAYMDGDEITDDFLRRGKLFLIDERMLNWAYFSRPEHGGRPTWMQTTSLKEWLERYVVAWEQLGEKVN